MHVAMTTTGVAKGEECLTVDNTTRRFDVIITVVHMYVQVN